MRKIALIILLSKRAMHILGNDSLSDHRKNYGNSEIKKIQQSRPLSIEISILSIVIHCLYEEMVVLFWGVLKSFLCVVIVPFLTAVQEFFWIAFFSAPSGVKWWKLTDLSGNVQLKWLVHFDLPSINLQYFKPWRTTYPFICKLISWKWKYVAPSAG